MGLIHHYTLYGGSIVFVVIWMVVNIEYRYRWRYYRRYILIIARYIGDTL